MNAIKHIISNAAIGAVGVPVIVGSFVGVSSDTPGWAGFRAEMIGEARLFAAWAVVGAVGGLIYGLYTTLAPERAK